MRIHGLMESSAVNGPGDRAVIWLQGCVGMNCPGCWNPGSHNPHGGSERSLDEILRWLDISGQNIEGVTISGGEPMQQAPLVAILVEAIGKTLPRLSIGMFSGYSEAELNRGAYRTFPNSALSLDASTQHDRKLLWWSKIRSCLDFAVLGRFNGLKPSADPLTTSSNQRLYLYSGRYTTEDFGPQAVEVFIDDTGFCQITGFPVKGEL